MNPHAPELQRLSPSLCVWQRYDPKVKADLSSTAITIGSGIFLIDPIPLSEAEIGTLLGDGNIAGVIVTNANHLRASSEYAAAFSVPIHAHRDAMIPAAVPIEDGDQVGDVLRAIVIEGAAPGELTFYCDCDGGTLIVGDALINFGSNGFCLLPAKYCSQPRRLPKSLRRLLDLNFERILFAHGTPIVTNAHDRLAKLLG